MARGWQVLIFATCSLALGSVSQALAREQQQQPLIGAPLTSPMPYSPVSNKRIGHELAAAASTDSASGFVQAQPSIYHSIIDQTASSNRMASPIQTSANTLGDLNTAAGHHHGHAHGKYYEYREVPKKKTWKFGYKRGNHKHHIERHEHGQAGKHPHFKTKVKWADQKSKGKGIHLWDYNHHDKKHYHHG